MGFLGGLKKIGSIALKGASFLPIPGAGALGKAGDALGAIGQVAGGGATAAKEGRMDEAQLQALINAQNNRAQFDAAALNQKTQGDLMRRALAARMMGDLQAPTDPRGAKFAQPMNPVMQAMLAKYGDMADKDVSSGSYKVNPTMSAIPKSGAMEKIGGTLGTVGGMLGALGQAGLGRKAPMPDVPRLMGGAVPGMGGAPAGVTPLEGPPDPSLLALLEEEDGFVNPNLGVRF